MLIKNLPRPIKELVFKRQIEQRNKPNEELKLTYGKSLKNFTWTITPEGYTFWLKISKENYKPFFEKYGGVILCTSVEQGAKIIEYFKSLGVDTKGIKGTMVGNYYGLHNVFFLDFTKSFVESNNIPIFTLEELGVQTTQEQPQQPELPEINFEGIEMDVSSDGVNWYKKIVIAKINERYLTKGYIVCNYARPIQQKVKITKEQIAEAFNTTVELLEIE